jgi:murein DD-endopeptidase MepM/ murein hydrolase activator NlpD
MALKFRFSANTLKFSVNPQAALRRMRSATFWLQATACAVFTWSILQGSPVSPPGAADETALTASGETSAAGSRIASNGTQPSTAAAPGGQLIGAVQLASASPLDGAKLALSTIDIIVSRNDTLDRIFRRLKLNLADLASLRSLPGVRLSLDSLQPGERLHVTHHDGELVGLERRLNDSETLKVSREGDGLKAEVLQNALVRHTRTVRATIDSSLFESVEAAGGHEQTAVELADIFGWDIDFALDVRSGDEFAVTYQEIWRDGAYVKDGPIEAAEFINQGRAFRAVRYTDADGNSRYYTPDGRSLRRAFLRTPVEFTRVSSHFASARLHPILNTVRAHKGVDYAAPIGTAVHAAGDGRIRFAGWMNGYGNMVEIEHSSSVVTVYGHLSAFAHGTRVGRPVTQGTVIAYVGMTGLATGPHLHYEYRVNGVFKNPQTVALPAAEPIDPRWRADFLARSAPLLDSLDPAPGAMLVSR